ncbi:GTPase ObgE [Holospora curviuscula]|uniref:GTPase Obg n=1 Tax=Holospora curviuscula TaxID=1082868 RepID=A0A2S5R993_9PROT|nr:GTPase ObgE [Holospora curviuscula]PPE03896.1 GTPase Obg/CgtA [Holospora curviuscula]
MQFVQDAKILIKSGSGGSGSVSFRREKNIEFGGPDGGNGGKGGDVLVQGSVGKSTLLDFRLKRHYTAEDGHSGAGRCQTGKAGKNLILYVPLGTEVWMEGEKIADITRKHQTVVLFKGGKGGAGNACLKNSVHQAPRVAYPGESGQEAWIELKLKLLADIGLIGMPNAGKSTLLNALTEANSKVGDYPFTTLFPKLGVLYWDDKEVVLADLPGLIEDAHLGKGLGYRFLSHAQRCRILLHMVDATQQNPLETYNHIRKELKAFDLSLVEKQEIIVFNKSEDLTELEKKQLKNLFSAQESIFFISALYRQNLNALISCVGSFF